MPPTPSCSTSHRPSPKACPQLPEMKKYAKMVGAAEEEYMPSGPPMSPLTASFFTTWAFYDLRFDGTDTHRFVPDRGERRDLA